ncbi:relaxase/mobilization nuclease domain-containing protein [uncultured Flavobacterium sp.]|uniref:relaxase/mobilization nuclease domain-containing protein n=1 Tax=uncultured Flavobacterium sp. TaxID=165435 RepID=UPI0025920C47|nr:relaxase/mobilization nuclease domain-containing protein [uncultured Flavobacterium sp.]
MVTVIKTGSSIHNIFNYNENKVKQKKAECIGEGNYPVDVEKMNVSMRLNRFLKQNALNENVKRNSVHISLNFDPSETALTNEKLVEIAKTYMEKIGFGKQPYLIYRHYDAGHPHIHLVSVKVKEDGSRIDMHNIGRNQSETARKEIEETFGLVKAEGRKNSAEAKLAPIVLSAVQYGKMQSKKAIGIVLKYVLLQYKYGSLSELNAVLALYNVLADRGNEDSRVFKSGGLVYRILDENGKAIGVPIKASDFYSSPTLKFLDKRFEFNNASSRIFEKKRIKNKIDLSFLDKSISLIKIMEVLKRDGIDTVLRKSAEGKIYGITYVDHATKCVFNGSSLGKLYSAKALQEKCLMPENNNAKAIVSEGRQPTASDAVQHFLSDTKNWLNGMKNNPMSDFKTIAIELVEKLTALENSVAYIPYQIKGKQKKKRKRRQSNNQ